MSICDVDDRRVTSFEKRLELLPPDRYGERFPERFHHIVDERDDVAPGN